MTFHRYETQALPWPDMARIAGAFAFGAAIAWLAGWAIDHLRPGPGPISDDIVLRRVRARISELVSRPDAVAVSVENGVVRLAGEVPAEERDTLLTQLLYMPGVVRLRNALGAL
jgi:broad specificity phosphatase PhoE